MKFLAGVFAGMFLGAALLTLADSPREWPWGPELDAVAAAPESHRVLLENEHVRVLEVVIRPGEKEPAHTHPWPSVMVADSPARIRYYNSEDRPVFEHPEDRKMPTDLGADWTEPEGLHAVECIDEVPFHAIRVELKQVK